jgi:hypothetical protein
MPIPTTANSSEALNIPSVATAPHAPQPERFQPVALVLSIVFPGLGHLYLRQRRRAPLIAVGVMGLFLSGLLIGGIDCIDRRENPVWFAGQALVGPVAWGADWLHQNQFKVRDAVNALPRDPRPDELRDPKTGFAVPAEHNEKTGELVGKVIDRTTGEQREIRASAPPMSKSLGGMNYLGTLFAAVAGMLNLIVIVDASFHAPRPEGAKR